MPELILLRHAKSSWDDSELEDIARPLSERGTKAALRIGNWLAEQDLGSDLVLCSTAVRTRATLMLALRAFPEADPVIIYREELYCAPAEAILADLHRVEDRVSRVMVVGHNPGMHALAVSLTGSGRKADIKRLAQKFPTGALAHFSFETDWKNLAASRGQLLHFIVPRALD